MSDPKFPLLTESEIKSRLDAMVESLKSMDDSCFVKPIGNGLYKWGDVIMGEGGLKMVDEQIKKHTFKYKP